jgi:hypothetical protein
MSTRTDLRGACALLLLVGVQAGAAPATAPAQPLDDPAALKAAFATRIGHPVQVLTFRLGEHYSETLVESADGEFDVFEASAGQPLAEGKPKKAGEVDCRKKTAFESLDLAIGARLLGQARAIAAANGYSEPESIELGAGMMCEDFGWRALLTTESDSSALLELRWSAAGDAPKARQFRGDRWVRLDPGTLAAGGARITAAPKARPVSMPGDGRTRDFFGGIEPDLARLEGVAGTPLAFHVIDIDRDQLSVVLAQRDGKERATWLVGKDGSLRLWHVDSGPSAWCRKPFTPTDVQLAGLPGMIDQAPTLIPPMATSRVVDVTIRRSDACGRPHVYIKLEDERGFGNVEYDARGTLLRAEIQ